MKENDILLMTSLISEAEAANATSELEIRKIFSAYSNDLASIRQSDQQYFTTMHVLEELSAQLPSYASRHLPQAFLGDADAAESLIYAAPNRVRGAIAVGMYRATVPTMAFRAALRAVWDHDHDVLIQSAGNRSKLIAMFRRADFDMPEMPDMVTAWRGVRNTAIGVARRGYSWSVRREVACWFAMRHLEEGHRPLVLRAVVPKAEVIYFGDERNEAEVVFSRVPKAAIDGCQADWQLGFSDYEKAKKSRELESAKGLVGSPAATRQHPDAVH
jgi:hypothetical protein